MRFNLEINKVYNKDNLPQENLNAIYELTLEQFRNGSSLDVISWDDSEGIICIGLMYKTIDPDTQTILYKIDIFSPYTYDPGEHEFHEDCKEFLDRKERIISNIATQYFMKKIENIKIPMKESLVPEINL